MVVFCDLISPIVLRTRTSCSPAWPFSKSKFNLNSDRVNLVAPASPIECLLYLPNVRAIQYKGWPGSEIVYFEGYRYESDNPSTNKGYTFRIQSLSSKYDYFCLVKSALQWIFYITCSGTHNTVGKGDEW